MFIYWISNGAFKRKTQNDSRFHEQGYLVAEMRGVYATVQRLNKYFIKLQKCISAFLEFDGVLCVGCVIGTVLSLFLAYVGGGVSVFWLMAIELWLL